MKSLFRVIDNISEWTGKLVAFLVYAGICILVWEVIMRYIFNAPTIWAHGVSQRIFATYYILTGAYVLRQKGHVSMDIAYNRFSIRTRAILDLITASFFFAFCGVLLWQGSKFAWVSLMRLEPCGTPLRAPLYPIKLMIPLGSFLILVQGLAKYGRDLITSVTGRQCEY